MIRDVRLWRDAFGRACADVPHYPKHSDDFEWGYGGSGPADLAYSILRTFFGAPFAEAHYQTFKWDVVAAIPRTARRYTIPAETIRAFAEARGYRIEDVA